MCGWAKSKEQVENVKGPVERGWASPFVYSYYDGQQKSPCTLNEIKIINIMSTVNSSSTIQRKVNAQEKSSRGSQETGYDNQKTDWQELSTEQRWCLSVVGGHGLLLADILISISVVNHKGNRYSMSSYTWWRAWRFRARGVGHSIYPWVRKCGPAPHTLTLFQTNIADFLTLFKVAENSF